MLRDYVPSVSLSAGDPSDRFPYVYTRSASHSLITVCSADCLVHIILKRLLTPPGSLGTLIASGSGFEGQVTRTGVAQADRPPRCGQITKGCLAVIFGTEAHHLESLSRDPHKDQ